MSTGKSLETRMLQSAAILLLIGCMLSTARGASNWTVDTQLSGTINFDTCSQCTFPTPDGGWSFVGRELFSEGLTVVHYGADGQQQWLFETAGNFQYPQGPLATAIDADGSLCIVTQNLLADVPNSVSAIRLDAFGKMVWQTPSIAG